MRVLEQVKVVEANDIAMILDVTCIVDKESEE